MMWTLDGSCWFWYGHVTLLFVTLIGQNLLLALTHPISSLSEKLIASSTPKPPQVVGILQSNSGAITLFLHLFFVLPPG